MAARGPRSHRQHWHAGERAGLHVHRPAEQLHRARLLKAGGVLAAVALQAKVARLGPQSRGARARVFLMANQAALLKDRAVQVSLLDPGGGEVFVTTQAEIHRTAAHLMGIGGGVRAVAGNAAALAPETAVGELGLVEAFLDVGVATQAELAAGAFDQGDAPVPRRLMAEVALL